MFNESKKLTDRSKEMTISRDSARLFRQASRLSVLAVGLLALGACVIDQTPPTTSTTEYRMDRFNDLAVMRDFRACKQEGFALDKQAQSSGTRGAYLTSARVLAGCEAKIGPAQVGIGVEERMLAYGVSIQNYIKGGDRVSAREKLKNFNTKFAGRDFYYPDGTSYVRTMETLLGTKDDISYGEFSALNVNRKLKSEMRRLQYWKNK